MARILVVDDEDIVRFTLRKILVRAGHTVSKLELDREKLAIENEIDEAELDNKQRQKISTMAMRALERQRKS